MTIQQTNRILWLGILIMLALNGMASATDKLWISITDLNTFFPFNFMPPGRAFMASWGLIYVGLLVFFVFFVRASYKINSPDTDHVRFSKLFATIIGLNIAWIIATTQQWWIASVIIIMGMMYTLYEIIRHLNQHPSSYSIRGKFSRGIYLGWITVATVVLGISQIVYSVWTQGVTLVLSNNWTYSILLLWVIKSLWIYYKIRNPYTLIWSLFALGACTYAAFW